jgi:PPK2 family polyphosphate:nucleotide phosphotransferase
MYAHDRFSLLLIFQAMDAAGKDGTIKHVMTGVNPQGCQVFAFKKPSDEELDHDYLWRTYKCFPERGRIGIFNRSYYEEVLIVKVHPGILLKQKLPAIKRLSKVNKVFWEKRYRQINDLEQHLVENGTIVLKFFLNVSKEEQKKRFLKRINNPDKNWKFTMGDVEERQYWDKYQQAFEDVLNYTSTEYAPWYIIPADKKWYMRTVVGDIIVHTLESLPLKYPAVSKTKLKEIQKAKEILENES